MSRTALFSVAAAFLFLAVPAAAHQPSGHWGDRASPKDPAMSVIDKKLDAGAHSGALNAKELKHLRAERGKLMSMKRRALLDGVLTRGEYKRVHREELRLIKAIDKASARKVSRKAHRKVSHKAMPAKRLKKTKGEVTVGRTAHKASRVAPERGAERFATHRRR